VENSESKDLTEIIEESSRWLRKAMRSSAGGCEVRKRVDAKLLETLWCPCRENSQAEPTWYSKDVVRSDLESETFKTGVFWENTCEWNFNDNCPQCFAGELLARNLLGPMGSFFQREEGKGAEDNPLLWVVAKLFDQLGECHFYRTLSGMQRDQPDYRVGQLLFRIPEAEYNRFKEEIADFSTLVLEREENEEVDYCLICNRDLVKKEEVTKLQKQIQVYDVSDIMEELSNEELAFLRKEFAEKNNKEISSQLSQKILSEATRVNYEQALARQQEQSGSGSRELDKMPVEPIEASAVRAVTRSAIERLERLFYGPANNRMPTGKLHKALSRLIREVKVRTGAEVDLLSKEEYWKLANYFVWLKALHPDLGSYTVRYASSYRLIPNGVQETNGSNQVKNPCFIIASKMLPSSRLLADARISLTQSLEPLEDYYVVKLATQAGQRSEFLRWIKIMGHEFSKVYTPLAYLLNPAKFQQFSHIRQKAVLEFANETFTLLDLWAVTGKHSKLPVNLEDFADTILIADALQRCCDLALKFEIIKDCSSALEHYLEHLQNDHDNIWEILHPRGEGINLTNNFENSAAFFNAIPKRLSSLYMEWFSLIVVVAMGNAIKNKDSMSPLFVELSSRIEIIGPVMLLKIGNWHSQKKLIENFYKKYPHGLMSPKYGTFLVLDKCGEALYGEIGLQNDYRLSDFCSVNISDYEFELTLRFPIGRSA